MRFVERKFFVLILFGFVVRSSLALWSSILRDMRLLQILFHLILIGFFPLFKGTIHLVRVFIWLDWINLSDGNL
jgi:hypothetical protein